MNKKLNIRKGDNVVVITGKNKGVKGRVLKVFPATEKLIVENVNFHKKHVRPNRRNQQGGILEKEAPIHVSNVMLFNTKINSVTKPIMKTIGDKRIRVCKKTGDELN
jgi:large subunit ribosomal protein L24